ncbi:MAG TPA: GAF domain-containing protein [Burkholderiaceae bacterium]|nr:GAF domain-containing protein [Burkholderiaceae bacterium]
MTDPSDLQQISGRLERGEIDSARYLEELMRFVAAQIGCSRAGLRLFVDTPPGRVLRSIAMYDADADRMIAAPDIAQPARGLYTEQLHRDGSVVVTDAATDPVTAGGLRDYLRGAGIGSLMDMSCSVNGGLFGTFSCEQRGAPLEWSQRQQQTLRKIASRASLTLMHLVNTSIDTTPGALWSTSTPNRLTTMPMPLDMPPGEEA